MDEEAKKFIDWFHGRHDVIFLRIKAQDARNKGDFDEVYHYDDILIDLYKKYKEEYYGAVA